MANRRGKRWTEDELLLAFELFQSTSVRPDARDSQVQALAGLIGRTPSSVALKLLNFRSVATGGRNGMSHASGLDRKVFLAATSEPDQVRARAAEAKLRLNRAP